MICGCGSVYHNCKTTAYGKRYHIIMTNPFDVHDAGHDVLVMETYMYYKIFLSSIDIVYCESRVGAVHGFQRISERGWAVSRSASESVPFLSTAPGDILVVRLSGLYHFNSFSPVFIWNKSNCYIIGCIHNRLNRWRFYQTCETETKTS